MAKATPYQVLVHDLPVRRQFHVPPLLVSDWLKGLPMRDVLGAPDPDPNAGHGAADLELYAEDVHAFAAGTFKGHLVVACSRCVNEVRLDIDEQLRVTFMPPSEMPADDDDAADGRTAPRSRPRTSTCSRSTASGSTSNPCSASSSCSPFPMRRCAAKIVADCARSAGST